MKKLLAALGLLGVYAFIVRPRMLRAGATDEEVEYTFPGKELIPDGKRGTTMAITIDAPPRIVWSYLIQMGLDRGGWYSWDRLDNWGKRSTTYIHPEWQNVKVGDRFFASPDGSQVWDVAACDPEQFLSLRASIDLHGKHFDPSKEYPKHFTDSTWSFMLDALPNDRTRLVVSGYWAMKPTWLQPLINFFLLEPSHWVMQTRQFSNIKRYAERDARRATVPTGFNSQKTEVI